MQLPKKNEGCEEGLRENRESKPNYREWFSIWGIDRLPRYSCPNLVPNLTDSGVKTAKFGKRCATNNILSQKCKFPHFILGMIQFKSACIEGPLIHKKELLRSQILKVEK